MSIFYTYMWYTMSLTVLNRKKKNIIFITCNIHIKYYINNTALS